MVNDLDQFMMSEGTKTFILAITLKTGQSVAQRGHKIFHLDFSVLQRIYEGRLINSRNSPLINSFLHQITRKLVYK